MFMELVWVYEKRRGNQVAGYIETVMEIVDGVLWLYSRCLCAARGSRIADETISGVEFDSHVFSDSRGFA